MARKRSFWTRVSIIHTLTETRVSLGVLTADIILSIPFIFIPLIVDGINAELYEIDPQSITIFMTKDKK